MLDASEEGFYTPVEEAIRRFGDSEPVVVVAEGHEVEIDIVAAGSLITGQSLNRISRLGNGQLLVAVHHSRLNELDIPLMTGEPADTASRSRAFAATVDVRRLNAAPGSSRGMAATIRALADSSCGPADFSKPGMVRPLAARQGGVLRRAGHTEAGVDLATLAGLPPVAVLSHLENEDGDGLSVEESRGLAAREGLAMLRIAQLIAHRRRTEKLIEKLAETALPTAFGEFRTIAFRDLTTGDDHVALVKGDVTGDPPPLVRVHDECLTGDVFGSQRCDCGPQLEAAMGIVAGEGRGVVLYMRQEGRGIGLANKLRAYALQDAGLDTVEANLRLGFQPDERDYGIGCQILVELGLSKIRLLTNNPRKRSEISGYGLEIVESVPLIISPGPFNARYLRTKAEKMGHELG